MRKSRRPRVTVCHEQSEAGQDFLEIFDFMNGSSFPTNFGWVNKWFTKYGMKPKRPLLQLSLPRRVVVLGSIAIADAASEMGHEIFKRASFWLASSFYQH